ncbi:MAG: CAP domain-containing protein [Bacillota bacterium]
MKRKLTVKNPSLVLAGEFAAFGAGAVILLVFIASTLDASLVQNGQQAAVVTSVLADLTNSDRELNHVPDLKVSPTLTQIAQMKANDMAAKGYFSHDTPDGKTPWYWFKLGGYAFRYAGENLAVDFSDSADVERAWMKSPTHRENILNGNYTEIGIATAVGMYQGHRTIFVVQEFGTPVHTSTVTGTTPPARVATAPKPFQTTSTPTKTVPTNPKKSPVHSTTAIKPAATTTLAVTEPTPTSTVLGSTADELPLAETAPYASSRFDALLNVFAASPRTTMQYAYYLFAFLIMIAILVETGFEVHKRHVKHVVFAVTLMVLMGTLFFAAEGLVFGKPVIVDSGGVVAGAS